MQGPCKPDHAVPGLTMGFGSDRRQSMLPRATFVLSLALVLGMTTLLANPPVHAQTPGTEISKPNPSGLTIPRWVSIRAGEVNMRTGPGARYPIDWVLQQRRLPVEVVGEFENWRKVRARDDTIGWVHKSMLSGKRMASVAVARARILNGPNSKALVTAFVEEGVIVRLDGCEPEWCHVSINSHDVEGWIPRAALWGLHPGETVER
jgi:SH3-like domain-containing protein